MILASDPFRNEYKNTCYPRVINTYAYKLLSATDFIRRYARTRVFYSSLIRTTEHHRFSWKTHSSHAMQN